MVSFTNDPPAWLHMSLHRYFVSLAVHKFRRYGQLSYFSNWFIVHFGLTESNSILDLALSVWRLNLCYLL